MIDSWCSDSACKVGSIDVQRRDESIVPFVKNYPSAIVTIAQLTSLNNLNFFKPFDPP